MEACQCDESNVLTVDITTLAGETVDLMSPVVSDDVVEDLRSRIAQALKVAARQIVIFFGETELLDGQALRDVVTDSQVLALSVQKMPCQLRPQEYKQYIDSDTTAFVQVSKMQYPFFHPVLFPEGTTHMERYSRARELGKPVPWEGSRHIGQAKFPEPQGISINMLPFIMGKKDSLPEAYQHYWPLIDQCNVPPEEGGKICYLTIQESQVSAGHAQRRGGVHIESPGWINDGGYYAEDRYNWGCGVMEGDASKVKGGIYMASNISNSCKIWDVKIKSPTLAADKYGGIEHMRDLLGEGVCMEADKIYWLTDATPHESLPLAKDEHRQFFRLVTSSLSAWYSEHSTANELVEIDQSITKVVSGSKFVPEVSTR